MGLGHLLPGSDHDAEEITLHKANGKQHKQQRRAKDVGRAETQTLPECQMRAPRRPPPPPPSSSAAAGKGRGLRPGE